MSYLLWSVCVWSVILIAWAQVLPTVDIRPPLRGFSYNVRLKDIEYSYYAGEYFATHLNFADVPNGVVVGSSDRLSLLNEDLTLVQNISMATTNGTYVTSCLASQNTTDAAGAVCRNLIRVFSSASSNSSQLVVCGSEAAGTPTCRAVSVSDGSLVSSAPTPTTSGILSTNPKYFEYGDIIGGTSSSTATFFSVATYSSGSQADQFNMSYYNFTYSNISDPASLQVTRGFQLKSGWLTTPVTMVGVHKGNYPPRTVSQDQIFPDEHFVYFLFFREYNPATNTSMNRVGRLCQNDYGLSISPNVKVISSFLKTSISCTDPSLATVYNYNYMQSSAPNGKGRFFVNGDWAEFVYAAFSNFQGTEYNNSAICVYRADNSKIDSNDAFGFNGGVFDTFRSSYTDNTNNVNIECLNSNTDADRVELKTPIVQFTANPLAMFSGFVISVMVVDQTCVVLPNDPSMCANQDVLFLGTSLGKVIKMSMVVEPSGAITPVTSQEITLNGVAPARQLSIHSVGGVKYLYVNTDSNIYRLPIQRCGNYTSCRSCVGSRDPYCVWNMNTSQCMMSSLVPSAPYGTASVPAGIYQNIHTGFVSSCPVWRSCSFTSVGTYYSSPLGICVTCQFVRNVTVVFNGDIMRGVAMTLLPSPYNALEYSGCGSLTASGLQSYTLSLLDDTGSQQDTAYIRPPEGPPVPLSNADYIIDRVQNTSFRITMTISQYGHKFDTYYYQVLYNSSTLPTQVTTYTRVMAQPSVTLSGFQAGDIVSYQIVVSNGYPAPPIYSTLNTVTLRSGIPGPPTNLAVTSASDVGVVLSWAPPTSIVGAIIGYSIWMNGVQVTQCALSGQSPSYVASDLMPASVYSFAVSACTTSGEGPTVTVAATTRCTPPAEVQNFVFVSIPSGLSYMYTWDPPVGNYDSLQYQVDSVCYGSVVTRVSLLVRPKAPRSWTLTGLDPQVTCCVSIYAIANCSLTYGNTLPLTGAQATFCQLMSDVVPLAVRNLSSTPLSPASALLSWGTPLNYLYAGYPSSISYNVTVATVTWSSVTMTMAPRLLLTSLDASTSYNVSVTPSTPAGSGPPATTTFTTSGLLPPPPPTNVTLQVAAGRGGVNLTVLVAWSDPTSVLYNVTSYAVRYRCNDVIYNETMATALAATFYVPLAPYVWCSASVQGVNVVGRSMLSSLAENYFPQTPPPTPGCYETANLGAELDFEFDMTDALTLSNKTVSAVLTVGGVGGYTGVVEGNRVNFTMLARNQTYLLQVALCNRAGCGSPCVLSGNTQLYPPDPPDQVNVSKVTNTTAQVTWSYPPRENPSSTQFNAVVTLSGTTVQELSNLNTTSLKLEALLPGVTYTLSLRTLDATVGVVSSAQANVSFSTLPMAATEPRGLVALYNESSLLVMFTQPLVYSGIPLGYDLLWSPMGESENCSLVTNGAARRTIPFNASLSSSGLISVLTSGLDLMNVQNQSVTVCARLSTITSDGVTNGMWASVSVEKSNVGGLKTGRVGSTDDITGIVIAVLLFALFDAVLLSALFTAVAIKKWRERRED